MDDANRNAPFYNPVAAFLMVGQRERMQERLNFIDECELKQRDVAKKIKTLQGRVNNDVLAMMTGTGVRHSDTLDLFNRNYPAPRLTEYYPRTPPWNVLGRSGRHLYYG